MEPSEQNALASFVGATWGQVKQLDDNIVGTSVTLNRRSDDVRRVLEGMVQPQVPQQQPQVIIQQPTFTPQVNVQVTQTPSAVEDGQLFLDLRQRDEIYSHLTRLEEKMDTIILLLSKKRT